MDIETLWKFGMTLPHTETQTPFGPDTLTLKVGGKIFALLDLSGEWSFYNIKVDRERGIELRDRYTGIQPAYHMNKEKWISVDFNAPLPDSMHRSLLVDSYREVLKTMSRKQRNTLVDFNIRPTTTADIPHILEIFAKAKKFMREQGNLMQWNGDYPGEAAVTDDMSRGWSMVIEHCGQIVGTFCLISDPEPTYGTLPAAEPYCTLHRVASGGGVPGIVEAAVNYARATGRRVRIDTHPDNRPMLKNIRRLKMKPIGQITLADNTPRLVFEI